MMQLVKRANPQLADLTAQFLRDTTGDLSADYICSQVSLGVIPAVFIQRAVPCLDKAPMLATMQIEDFMAAVRAARPECYDVFQSPQGQKWIQDGLVRVAQAWGVSKVKGLFGVR